MVLAPVIASARLTPAAAAHTRLLGRGLEDTPEPETKPANPDKPKQPEFEPKQPQEPKDKSGLEYNASKLDSKELESHDGIKELEINEPMPVAESSAAAAAHAAAPQPTL